jgi:hypothetical protein
MSFLSLLEGDFHERIFFGTGTAAPWNKGRLITQKLPLKLKEIWAIRIRKQARSPDGKRTRLQLHERLKADQTALDGSRLVARIRRKNGNDCFRAGLRHSRSDKC